MNRRGFLLGGLALAGCGAGLEDLPMASHQTQLTLHRHAYQPLRGESGGDLWRHAGNALSASSSKIYGEFGLSPLLLARLVIAWVPNDNGTGQTGVRVVIADDGPANMVEVFSDRQTGDTPRVSWRDITGYLNEAVIAPKVSKQVLLQTLGNGRDGPLVYAAWLDLVWA